VHYEEKIVASWANEKWARRASPTNSGGKPPHSTWCEVHGKHRPRKFAGHSMLCPYNQPDHERLQAADGCG
jgi:hypothetical protein